mgnify:CR=1 FL=1
MCAFLKSVDWLELIQTIAACLTVVAAFLAINTWKHQSKAQKQTDFLDILTDTVHEYIEALSRPQEYLKFLRIGFESYRGLHGSEDDSLKGGVISYIEKNGEHDAKRMWKYLEPSGRLASKVNALVARGQVYGFAEYDQCRRSVEMLLWQHQRLQVVASMIGSTSLNWANPMVQQSIENMLTVQPENVVQLLKEHDVDFIEFVNTNYKRIYAGT